MTVSRRSIAHKKCELLFRNMTGKVQRDPA
jgi:hypothetical protein